MKHKSKELGLKDVTLLCERCNLDVSLLKTLNFVKEDMHQAKCVFGFLERVEIDQVIKDEHGYYADKDNKDFADLYLETIDEWKEKDKTKDETP